MAQLCHQQDKILEKGVKVVIISFDAPEFAVSWLKETGAPFEMLIDTTHEVYRTYGLDRSILRSWRYTTLLYYLRNWKKIPKTHTHSDLHQLGGDFVLDRKGILRFQYASFEPIDRPSIKKLCRVFDAIQQVN